jgi:hypothetical protein
MGTIFPIPAINPCVPRKAQLSADAIKFVERRVSFAVTALKVPAILLAPVGPVVL